MSRADTTRNRLPRIVNAINNSRPSSVCPRAKNRFSLWECASSAPVRSGELKNTCSASRGETWCRSQFFSTLPPLQSNPSNSGAVIDSVMLIMYTIKVYASSLINNQIFPPNGDNQGRRSRTVHYSRNQSQQSPVLFIIMDLCAHLGQGNITAVLSLFLLNSACLTSTTSRFLLHF